MGTTLLAETKKEIIDLLYEFVDAFDWSYQDMPGLNTEIVEYRLPLKLDCKPI